METVAVGFLLGSALSLLPMTAMVYYAYQTAKYRSIAATHTITYAPSTDRTSIWQRTMQNTRAEIAERLHQAIGDLAPCEVQVELIAWDAIAFEQRRLVRPSAVGRCTLSGAADVVARDLCRFVHGILHEDGHDLRVEVRCWEIRPAPVHVHYVYIAPKQDKKWLRSEAARKELRGALRGEVRGLVQDQVNLVLAQREVEGEFHRPRA